MKTHTTISSLCLLVGIVFLLLFAVPEATGQSQASVYATGLVSPQGITMDAQGQLWVAEQGSGNEDGRISVVTPDGQVHPFLVGLPSNIVQGQPESAHHLLIADGVLWATLGLGEESPDGFLVRADIASFTPGENPLSLNDVQVEDIGSFVRSHVFANDTDQTNIYNMAVGPNDDLFIVDASANAVLRREDGTGTLSVFAELPGIPNPTGVGPPVMQPVPTGIVFAGDRFYVSAFPGFPFAEGAARIFELDLSGTVTVFREGFTSAVDLLLDPEGNLVVVQFGQFDPASGFLPNTGSIIRITEDGIEPLASGLNFPTSTCLGTDEALYIAAFGDGQVLKLDAMPTAAAAPEEAPEMFTLLSNYPNPFNPATTIEYRVAQPTHIVLTIHNLLGQEVRVLVDERQAAGAYGTVWDGRNAAGRLMPTGVYFYRMQAGNHVRSRAMYLVK